MSHRVRIDNPVYSEIDGRSDLMTARVFANLRLAGLSGGIDNPALDLSDNGVHDRPSSVTPGQFEVKSPRKRDQQRQLGKIREALQHKDVTQPEAAPYTFPSDKGKSLPDEARDFASSWESVEQYLQKQNLEKDDPPQCQDGPSTKRFYRRTWFSCSLYLLTLLLLLAAIVAVVCYRAFVVPNSLMAGQLGPADDTPDQRPRHSPTRKQHEFNRTALNDTLYNTWSLGNETSFPNTSIFEVNATFWNTSFLIDVMMTHNTSFLVDIFMGQNATATEDNSTIQKTLLLEINGSLQNPFLQNETIQNSLFLDIDGKFQDMFFPEFNDSLENGTLLDSWFLMDDLVPSNGTFPVDDGAVQDGTFFLDPATIQNGSVMVHFAFAQDTRFMSNTTETTEKQDEGGHARLLPNTTETGEVHKVSSQQLNSSSEAGEKTLVEVRTSATTDMGSSEESRDRWTNRTVVQPQREGLVSQWLSLLRLPGPLQFPPRTPRGRSNNFA